MTEEQEIALEIRTKLETVLRNRKHADHYDFDELTTTLRCLLDVISHYSVSRK